MTALKILIIALFVWAWLKSRSSRTAEVSDFFVISFLAVYMPGFLLNPSGSTSLNALSLPQSAVVRAETAMLVVLGLGSVVMLLRCLVHRKLPIRGPVVVMTPPPRLSTVLAWSAAGVSALVFCALLLNPEFRSFKLDVAKFFTFQFYGNEYRVLRNVRYADVWLLEQALGRARFTLFPVLFCLVIYPLLKGRHLLIAAAAALVFFIALPASLSKLPVFFFLGYAALLVAARWPRLQDIGWISVMALVAGLLGVTMLILLYSAQYQASVINGAVLPLNLAIERIWGEPYSIVVRYFAVYPDMLPFTGWNGIGAIANLLGLPPRLPDIEVARTLLGPDSGSNPGAFFLGGYASFALAGLCVFAALGWLMLWALDLVGRAIRVPALKATYTAVIGMNVLFLNQIALHTALLTYGLAVVPVLIFIIDRVCTALASPSTGKGPSNRAG